MYMGRNLARCTKNAASNGTANGDHGQWIEGERTTQFGHENDNEKVKKGNLKA
jgi:hypothetical protein